jgi:hypothetical protein
MGYSTVMLTACLVWGASANEGDVFQLDGRRAEIVSLDALPYVDSEYSRIYVFDRYDNPKLARLRAKYRLDEVIAQGEDEFEKQVLLMAWVKAQFRFGAPEEGKNGLRNALEILEDAKSGKRFFCVQYAAVLTSTAASLGWVNRQIAIPRHTLTEMWSNQYRKWVMFDPTTAVYAIKGGVPLNAYEIREEWFRRGGKNLVYVMRDFGEPPKEITVTSGKPPFSVDRYRFLGYVPNTDLLDNPCDWARMFITRDDLCEGRTWHRRKNPLHPALDPYFPINQAVPSFAPKGANLEVTLKTLTPNFDSFKVRLDDGEWDPSGDTILWTLHDGINVLKAKSVNKFGVDGPVSTVVSSVK